MQQQGNGEAQQMMRDLQQMMQRQQQLLDKSFRARRQQGQPERGGQQQQQAARDFAQQLQKRLGNCWGEPGDEVGATDRAGRDRTERDPLGRPMSNSGTYDQSDVKIPDENILQKSRQILDELRRRAGERFRPPIELDYIDRLLKRF